ncbi:MAG: hypothetical protein AAGF12_11425 [Myxococcota bacterium]
MRLGFVVGLALSLVAVAGCTDDPPSARFDASMVPDGTMQADRSVNPGDCGDVSQECCTSGRRCESGSICDPSGTCCATTNGAECSGPDDCCGNLDCLGGECCAVTGQACRTASECCGSATCDNNVCTTPSADCGASRQECCTGDSCQDGLECVEDTCVPCGGEGEGCCRGSEPCQDALVCTDGMCAPAGPDCGMEDQDCCTGNACSGTLQCTDGKCVPPPEGCVQTTCGSCTAAPGGNCGWCGASNSCAEGTAAGPSSGSCDSGWEFGAAADCSTSTDTCPGLTGSGCSACITTDFTANCGWCASTNSCARGSASGPSTGSCAEWAWAPSRCMAPMTGCSMNAACDDCLLDFSSPSLCGWCSSGGMGRCLPGGTTGSTDGTCSGADWNFLSIPMCSGMMMMCIDQGMTCMPGGSPSCCTGLTCRSGLSLGVNCCREAGASCTMGNECCGFMDCIGGTCTCRNAGRACLANGDCCSGTCTGGTCT